MGFTNSNPTSDVAGSPVRRRSLIPNPQSLIPRARSAFTLIEMLIVIGIMLILVAAAATMMPSATESRRIREAARGVNIYLSSARNRAMETGRPCGVTFRCFGSLPCALNADQCEVPPCYAGESYTSTATITGSGTTFSVTFSDGPLSASLVRPGDQIQLNGQGPLYTVAGTASNPVDANGYLNNVGGTVSGSQPLVVTYDSSQGQMVPWGATASTVPFRIFRSPMKGGATPLQLPATSVVDLDFSSSGNNLGSGWKDLTILFSPTGAVDSVYYGSGKSTPTDPIYILIGKRERVGVYTTPLQPPAQKAETDLSNAEDLNNLWVTINVQTGMVNTEPMAADSGGLAYAAYQAGGTNPLMAAKIAAMVAARFLAAQAIGMGGK